MTQVTLMAAAGQHQPDDPDCPFCPGKEEEDYKTWRGADNKASKLRSNMKTPSNLKRIQSTARPKDGMNNRQPPDSVRPVYRRPQTPTSIYTHLNHGSYSDQAHHAISGLQILDGHEIEKLTCQDLGLIKKDTGYSVNNCANGVCLPAYPNNFLKGSSPLKGTWAELDLAEKQSIMELPMAANKGQAHIGGHDIPPPAALSGDDDDAADDATTDMEHHTNYPEKAKGELKKVYDRAMKRFEPECPWCAAAKAKGEKLPPPYRINQQLDNVSSIMINLITGSAQGWEYFISSYAQTYTLSLKAPVAGLPPPGQNLIS